MAGGSGGLEMRNKLISVLLLSILPNRRFKDTDQSLDTLGFLGARTNERTIGY